MPIDREKATLSLDEPVSRIRLVSPARAAALEKLGVRTLRDLLTHFPRSYIDLSQVETCGTARIGEVCTIRGTVHEIKLKKPRYNLKLVEIALVDGTGILIVTCFRQPWLMDQVKAGDAVAVSGKVTFDYGYKRMTNPFIEVIGEGEEVTGSVGPVHPATEKLTAAWGRRIVANGLEAAEGLFDPLPLGLRLRYRLMSRNAALRAIHFPRTMAEADEARRRLVYEELLYLELFLMQEGAARSAGCVPHAHVVDGPRLGAFAASLPFELTGEQQRARDEILAALAAPTVANHMLLGDVGTGKTVVAGHALAAAALNYTDPVTKVTILPRGRALGYTMVMPTEDRFNKTRNQLLDDLVYGMGGRVAEEIVFRDPSTGPANDIQQATKTARAMVTDYGMSDRIGMVKLGDADTEAFGHGSGEGPRSFSDETAAIIDEEVRRLLDNAMREAWRILSENRAVLDTLASRLLEEETLDEAQLAEIFKDVVKAPERPVWNYQSDAAVPGVVLGHPVGIKAEDEWTSVPEPGIDVSPTDVIGASGVEEEQE